MSTIDDEFDKFLENNAVKIDPQKIKNWIRAANTMKFLDIPCNTGSILGVQPPTIYATDLYDIFMDEDKLRVLMAKLRNKIFW